MHGLGWPEVARGGQEVDTCHLALEGDYFPQIDGKQKSLPSIQTSQ